MPVNRPSVSLAIMAHPKREAYIPSLKAALGRPVQVVWDQISDRWDTGRRSLLAYDSSRSHHVVIQDDALVCRDLPAGVEEALRHAPTNSILGLYLGRTRAWKPVWIAAQRSQPNLRWIRMRELMWGVGVVVPTGRIEEIVAIGDRFPEIANYDSRISAACLQLGIPVWYPWPSMVSHRQAPSLVEGRGWRGRYAYRFLGEGASALGQSWRGPAVEVQPPAAAIGRSRGDARLAVRRAH